jgi:hypothetical protein
MGFEADNGAKWHRLWTGYAILLDGPWPEKDKDLLLYSEYSLT